MSSNGSIHVFGTGVRVVSQITLESNYLLQEMEKVFHVEFDPKVSEYLADIGCTEVSLTYLYEDGRRREEAYQEICDTIIEAAKAGSKCAYRGCKKFCVNGHSATNRLRLVQEKR